MTPAYQRYTVTAGSIADSLRFVNRGSYSKGHRNTWITERGLECLTKSGDLSNISTLAHSDLYRN